MPNKITPRDMEAISAYLDNELKPKERARLEARLQAEPSLRAALDELNQTRALLRSMPQVRAPRNFTLTPAMAPRRSFSLRLLPTLQFASVLTAILLVVIVTGHAAGFLVDSPDFTIAQSSPTQELFSLQDTAEATEELMKAEALEAAEPSAIGQEGAATEAVMKGLSETQPEAEGLAESPAPEAGEVGLAGEAPAEPPTERLGTSLPSDSQQPGEGMSPLSTEVPATQLVPVLPPETPAPLPTEIPGQPISVPGLRQIEISLFLIVLATGIGAVALRKRLFG